MEKPYETDNSFNVGTFHISPSYHHILKHRILEVPHEYNGRMEAYTANRREEERGFARQGKSKK